MRKATFALALFVAFSLAAPLQAQYSRRNAIVEAVDRTRDGIVTLRVNKTSDYGRKAIVGTGVIVDERGYLITNAHVVEGATKITATLADRTALEAHVHAELPKYDLAILRLSPRKKL